VSARIGTLALVLALAAPASADNFYEYVRVLISPPFTCDSPCEITWSVPVPGIPIGWYVKQCLGAEPVVRDRYLTLYQSGANWPEGSIKLTLGDTHPGRTQTYCLRVTILPLPPEP